MFQLVPCPGCTRHVRLSDDACPFCAATLDVAALSKHHGARRVSAPAGLKRAALFALTTTAAACGGRSQADEDTAPPLVTFDDSQPVAGSSGLTSAPTTPTVNPTTTTPTVNPTTTTSPPVEPGTTDTGAPDTTVVPVYGAPVVTSTPAPTSEPVSETTEWGEPVYGAPIPTELTTEVPVVSSASVNTELSESSDSTTFAESSVATEIASETTATATDSRAADAGAADTETGDASVD